MTCICWGCVLGETCLIESGMAARIAVARNGCAPPTSEHYTPAEIEKLIGTENECLRQYLSDDGLKAPQSEKEGSHG